MRIAGVEQSVRMKISGHKTTSMEQRYNILDQADLKGAAAPKDLISRASRRAGRWLLRGSREADFRLPSADCLFCNG
jgi:hypothetical protein